LAAQLPERTATYCGSFARRLPDNDQNSPDCHRFQILIKPTVTGIRSGRDEALEEALRQIPGPDTPAAQIEGAAKPSRLLCGTFRTAKAGIALQFRSKRPIVV
jgi:hypothetical protein